MNPSFRRLAHLTGLLLVLLLAGCEVGDTAARASAPRSLVIEPSQLTLAQGTSGRVKAYGLHDDGSLSDLTSKVRWSAPAGVTLSSQGEVQASAPGQLEITASLDQLGAVATVSVSQATLVGLQIEEPVDATLAAGDRQTYRPVGLFSDGSQQELTGQATMQVADPSLARVGAAGEVEALGAGSTSLFASVGDFRAQTPLILAQTRTLSRITLSPSSANLPKGAPLKLKATGTYSDGSTQDISSQVSWRSSNTAVCTVASGGSVTTLKAGSATVSATFSSRSASAAVTCNTATLSSLTLTTGATLPKGSTQQLKATARYSNGTSYDVSDLATFRSGTTTVASVTTATPPRGLVKALATGQSVITATFGGRSAQSTVKVSAPTLTGFTLDPATMALPAGTTGQLTATALYSDGSRKVVSNEASFSTSAGAIATVSTLTPRGVVSAKAKGGATIAATYSGRTARSSVTVQDATVSSLRFEPVSGSLAAGTTQRFLARALFSDGSQRDVTAEALLSVENGSLAQLTQTAGEVRGLAPGSTRLIGSYKGKSTLATLTVTPAVLTRIDVIPANATLPKGTQRQFSASGLYSDGGRRDVSLDALWSSDAPSVIAIGDDGLGQAVATGTARLSATLSGKTGTVTATVTPAVMTRLVLDPPTCSVPKGLTRPLTATAFYSDGTSREVTSDCSYVSTQPSVAAVSNATPFGVVTGLALGSAQITASYSGFSAETGVQVTAATLSSIRFEPGSATLPVGTAATFAVRAILSDGSQTDITFEATLSFADPAIAGIKESPATVQGLAAGGTDLIADYGGKTTRAGLTVVPAVLSRLEIAPAAPSFPKGTTLPLTATGVYSDGSRVDLSTSVAWSAQDSTVVSLDQSGRATGLLVGWSNVTASYEGRTAESQVTITPAVLTSLSVAPATTELALGQAQSLAVTAHFSDQSTLDVTAGSSFQSDDIGIASVSPAGLVTTQGIGRTHIKIGYSGEQATAEIAVSDAVLTYLELSPDDFTLAKGQTRALTAHGTFSDGASRPVEVDWASQAPDVAQIDSQGEVTALAVGEVVLTASAGGKQATARLMVNPAALTSITVTPASPSLPVGTFAQFLAQGTYSDGTVRDVTNEVVWSSTAPTVLHVADQLAPGLAQGLSLGPATVTATLDTLFGQATATVEGFPGPGGGGSGGGGEPGGDPPAFTLPTGNAEDPSPAPGQPPQPSLPEPLSRSLSERSWAANRYLAMATDRKLTDLDRNATSDVYLRDLLLGKIEGITLRGDGPSVQPSISEDGRFVVFASAAGNLASGDTGEHTDIFLWDRLSRKTTCLTSGAQGESAQPAISGDGEVVAFVTSAALVGQDSDGVKDVYLYQRETDQLTLVSGAESGPATSPTLNKDGSLVAYTAKQHGYWQVMGWSRMEARSAVLSRNSRQEAGNGDSFTPSLSESGLAFSTRADNLVVNDTNQKEDVLLLRGSTLSRLALDARLPVLARESRSAVFSSNGQVKLLRPELSSTPRDLGEGQEGSLSRGHVLLARGQDLWATVPDKSVTHRMNATFQPPPPVAGFPFQDLGLGGGQSMYFDVNSDGLKDVIGAADDEAGTRGFVIATANAAGDGTFTRRYQSLGGGFVIGYDHGDLNGDGHQDIVMTVNSAQSYDQTPAYSLRVWLGDGAGHFTASSSAPLSQANPSPVVGRFDSDDARPDVMLYSYTRAPGSSTITSQSWQIYRNTGTATFVAGPSLPFSGLSGPRTEDFDGDDVDDFVALDRSSGEAVLMLNNGAGAVRGAPQRLAIDSSYPLTYRSLEVLDSDQDGDPDVLIDVSDPSDGPPQTRQLTNSAGTLSFGPLLPIYMYAGSGHGDELNFMVDLDGDSVNEIVTTFQIYNRVTGATSSWPGMIGAVGFEDFNHDGKTDILSQVLNGLVVLTNRGGGDFGEASATPEDGFYGYGAEIGDFNGDLLMDLLEYRKLFLGSIDLTFTGIAHGQVLSDENLLLEDLDEDGDLDMVSYEGRNGFQAFLGDGAGHFMALPAQPVDSLWSIGRSIVDIDYDGHVDLMISTFSGAIGTSYQFWKGGGDGTFSLAWSGESPMNSDITEMVDLDGNGALDVWAGEKILFATSPGVFLPPEYNLLWAYRAFFADVDSDGFLEAVVPGERSFDYTDWGAQAPEPAPGRQGNPRVVSFRTRAAVQRGVFSGEVTRGTQYYLNELTFEDYDGDGDLDILGTDSNGNWYRALGDGAGNFDPQPLLHKEYEGYTRLNRGDFNFDGRWERLTISHKVRFF